MDTAAACDIARLPEDVLTDRLMVRVRSSKRVGEISPAPPSKKGKFPQPQVAEESMETAAACEIARLPEDVLTGRLMSMWTDRETGAKCYVLSARALQIAWGDTPQYWRWIPLTDSRFSEGAELLDVCWLDIHGKIHSKMLSQNSTYAAYMVFKMADVFYGLDSPLQEALVSVGGRKSTRKVCLQGYDNEAMDEDENEDMDEDDNEGEDVVLPQKRADGWLELEMGEFYSVEGEDGEVCISLTETKGGNWKKGLIMQGIEIKPKKSG